MTRRLKILVTHPEHWARGYAADFGAEVVHVDPGGDIPKRLDGSPTGDGIGQLTTPDGTQRIVNVADSFRPDVFLFGIHHNFQPWIVESVKQSSGCKVVMHYTDQRDGVPEAVSQYAGLLDLLLVTNTDEADHSKYVEAGVVPVVRTMLDGVDLVVYDHRNAWATPATHDVFFGGHDYHGLVQQFAAQGREPPSEIILPGGEFRHVFLSMVNAKFDMVVRGAYGWGPGFNVKPPVFHPHYHEAMCEGRIILSTTNAARRGLVTRRVLRSLASGRLFVTDFLPDTGHLFEDGKHLVFYNSLLDGLEKIERWLVDANERRKVEAAAARLVRENHTFRNRLADFVGIVKEVF